MKIAPITKDIDTLKVIPRKQLQDGDWFTYRTYWGDSRFRRLFKIKGEWMVFDEQGLRTGNGDNLQTLIRVCRYERNLKILDPMS